MKTKIAVGLLWMTLASGLPAQTAEDYLNQGRAYLAVTDLNAANRCFSNAVVRAPANPTANVLYAATRLLVLPYHPPLGDFLTRVGFPDKGRDIYHWTATLWLDAQGAPFVPTGLNATEFTSLLRTNVLAELAGAEANLAKVTSTDFTLALRASETRTVDVTLDYGDIQVLRAMLWAAQYCIYNAYSWNLEAELSALRAMLDPRNPTTLEQGLMAYPALLTFVSTNDLNAAKLAFQNGAERYLAGSLFIRSNRPPQVVRLFNSDPDTAANEERFRQTLADLKDSLGQAVNLSTATNYTVFLGAAFAAPQSPRSFLPWIRDNGFGLATLPDPTFGATIQGLSNLQVDQFLARHFQPIPTIADNSARAGGQFEFSLNVARNRGYVVQVSTNLLHWTDDSAFFATDWAYRFTDPLASRFPNRFYRVVDRTTNMPPPLNDDFSGRQLIPGLDVPVTGYNSSATREPREFEWPDGLGRTTWWTWTSTVSGEVAVVGSPWTLIAVFTGNSLHTGLAQLATGTEQVNFNAVSGTTYQILVDNNWRGGSEPIVHLVISRPPTLVISSPADNAQYESPAQVLLAGTTQDPSGKVPELTIHGSLNHVTHAPAFSFLETNLPGGQYYLFFSVRNSSGARTERSRSFWVRPSNDLFADAIPAVGAPVLLTGSTRGADQELNEPDHDGWKSVWWTWTPTNDGPVKIACSFFKANHQYYNYPFLGVYTGSSLAQLDPLATASGTNGQASVEFAATAFETYVILVDSVWTEGDLYLGIDCPAAPPAPISPLSLGVPVTNLAGAFDSQTLYRVTIPPGLPSLRISLAGGTGDCDLYVRHGFQPSLNIFDDAPYIDGNNESVNITHPAPGDWFILLHGFGAYSGVTLLAQ